MWPLCEGHSSLIIANNCAWENPCNLDLQKQSIHNHDNVSRVRNSDREGGRVLIHIEQSCDPSSSSSSSSSANRAQSSHQLMCSCSGSNISHSPSSQAKCQTGKNASSKQKTFDRCCCMEQKLAPESDLCSLFVAFCQIFCQMSKCWQSLIFRILPSALLSIITFLNCTMSSFHLIGELVIPWPLFHTSIFISTSQCLPLSAYLCPFLATLVALHLTPVSGSLAGSNKVSN